MKNNVVSKITIQNDSISKPVKLTLPGKQSDDPNKSQHDQPLKLVDVSIDEPDRGLPVVDIKLRNVGSEVVF
ncbi:MAG: hypothetical protein IPJ94_27885 [Chloroflexi bacterium]|nr:hypothetical protein [Chloroflexota bacterium]